MLDTEEADEGALVGATLEGATEDWSGGGVVGVGDADSEGGCVGEGGWVVGGSEVGG